jgi:hypothetical protein
MSGKSGKLAAGEWENDGLCSENAISEKCGEKGGRSRREMVRKQ